MRPVKIITDSCSDMPKELREKYDIDYVLMNVSINGKDTPANLDWEFMAPSEFYGEMREGKRFLTNQVPVPEFRRVFSDYAGKGYDIVYIGCSSKQSGSVNTGFVVAKEMMLENPEVKIFVVDSQNASAGETMLSIRAAEYRDQGLDAEAIYEKIMSERKKVNEFITVHSLEYLKNAGRVKASSAFFGNLLGVKPIIIADKEGYQAPIKKIKGRQNSLNEIVNLTKEAVIDPENNTIFIMHADCTEEANEIKALIEEAIPCKEIIISYIGPITGASIGPDAIGIWSYGKEVTFGE